MCNTSGHWKISQSFFRLRKKSHRIFECHSYSSCYHFYCWYTQDGCVKAADETTRSEQRDEAIFFILELSLKRNKCVEQAFSRCAVLNKHFIWTNETTTLFYIIYCNNYLSLELRAKIRKLCFDANALKMACGRMWLACVCIGQKLNGSRNDGEVKIRV